MYSKDLQESKSKTNSSYTEYHKKYYSRPDIKEKMRLYHKEYYQRNKERINKKHREYIQRKIKEDPSFKEKLYSPVYKAYVRERLHKVMHSRTGHTMIDRRIKEKRQHAEDILLNKPKDIILDDDLIKYLLKVKL